MFFRESAYHEPNITTWIFNDGFVPVAKITETGSYSIISDYLGTPVEAYDSDDKQVWAAELDIYGRVIDDRERRVVGDVDFVPFRYQGQYHDVETGLYYNRFRYYSPADGLYTQVDPIGLAGGNPTLYGYVFNPSWQIDPYGLVSSFLYRGDNSYKGGNVGLPLGSEADIMTPWEHVRRESNGETSIFTSFSEERSIAKVFGNVSKVSLADLKHLEAEGKIKIHTPDSVAEAMKNSGIKKLANDANNIMRIMQNNSEILIEGTIDGKYIKCPS